MLKNRKSSMLLLKDYEFNSKYQFYMVDKELIEILVETCDSK